MPFTLPQLELRSRLPKRANGKKPPLLFVHGGYSDSWCWDRFFLPWFAQKGYPAHAVSLRGHGTSEGTNTLFIAGLDDYAADVERTAAALASPPVLIGHSMGAAILERLMTTRSVRAVALLAPVPPAGLLTVAARLAAERPDYLVAMSQLDPSKLSRHVLETLQPFYFREDIAPEIVAEASRHLGAESPRALLDLSLRLQWQLPDRGGVPLLVLGVEGDRISSPDDARATARHHGVDAVILPGLAHMLMLEREWERPARALMEWIGNL